MAIATQHPVPHYDIYGHQHHRLPFKDKSHLLAEDIRHPRWLADGPAVRSRSELQQARKQGRVPDPSYDFDGDGVVGQLDYFIGRSFDKDNDGHLSQSERSRAKQALDAGFLDRYMRGLDSTGQAHRGCRVQQKRGVVAADDNAADSSRLTYPPHFNAHKVPETSTRTALQLSRTADLKGAGAAFGERYMADNAPVPEPQPPNARTQPRSCPISSIRERAEADHQASRVRGGLLPVSAPVNLEREHKAVGLGRAEEPLFATRSQLMETRKEAMRQDCEALRLKGEETSVPLSVRKTEKDLREFEFRRPEQEPMTRTRLQDQRRRERAEYDMRNFEVPRPREYPRFSERPDVPFWASGSRSVSGDEPPRAIARTASEPALKVNEVPFGNQVREVREPAQPAGNVGRVAPGEANFGSNTVKRWTTDMLERGQGRNKPRLFDNIQPVRIGPLDLQSLDLTSSMEPIRNAARNGFEEERKRNALIPQRSLLCADNTQMQMSMSAISQPSKPGSSGQHPQPTDASTIKGPGAQSRPTHLGQASSDPLLRPALITDRTEKPREPRFFGSTARSLSQTGVRCGGFQRFESPAKPARPQPRTKGDRGEHHSKERSRAEPPATPGAVPAAQPL